MSKRRRADMGAQGIKVGPRAFALFKRKINKIYKMTIYGKDEAQYLYKLKLKARKKYNDAEEIEVFVKKPLILTGLYDEEENRDTLPITIEAEPVEDDMIETEGTIVEDDMIQVNAVIIDAIFNSDKITKINLLKKFKDGIIKVSRAFYLSPYNHDEQDFDIEKVQEIPLDKLIEINIDNDVENYSGDSNNYGVYDKEKTKLLYYAGGLNEFEIDDMPTIIDQMAVAFRGTLETAEIPENITTIKKYSFYNCYNLETLRVPKSVTTVEQYTFEKAPVKTLYLASNVHRGASSTDGWGYWFKDTLEYLELYDISINQTYYREYASMPKLKIIKLLAPNIVGKNGYDCFSECHGIESIDYDVENWLDVGDDGIFRNAGKNFVVSTGYNSDEIYYYHSNATDFYYYISINSEEEYNNRIRTYGELYTATYNDISVKILENSVRIPNGLFSVSDGSSYYENLSATVNDVEFSEGTLKTIGVGSFAYCDNLKRLSVNGNDNLSFPNSLELIGIYSFGHCYNLNGLILDKTESNLTRINSKAFLNCESITGFILPNKTNIIENNGFENCYSMVTFETDLDYSSLKEINVETYMHCHSLVAYVVPHSAYTIGKRAFNNCNSLETLTIGCGITTIDDEATADSGMVNASSYDPNNSENDFIAKKKVHGSLYKLNRFYGVTFFNTKIKILNLYTPLYNYDTTSQKNIPQYYWGALQKNILHHTTSTTYNYNILLMPNTIGWSGNAEYNAIRSNKIYENYVPNTDYYYWDDINFNGYVLDNSIVDEQTYKNSIYLHTYLYNFESCNADAYNEYLQDVNYHLALYHGSYGYNYSERYYRLQNGTFQYIRISSSYDYNDKIKLYTLYVKNDSSLSIPEYYFAQCINLKNFNTIDDSNGTVKLTTVEEYGFYNCYNLLHFDFSNITRIEQYGFYNCQSLNNVILKNGLLYIGNYAFYRNQSIENITIPETVTFLGFCSFSGCYGLKSVVYSPTGATTANTYCFSRSGIKDVTTLTISNGVTEIGSYLFANFIFKNEIILPSSVAGVGIGGFEGSSIPSIVFSNSCSLGTASFRDCVKLTSAVFKSGMNGIPDRCFENTGLTSVNLIDIVLIENNAFENCTSLTSITFNHMPYFEYYQGYGHAFNTFKNCYNLSNVYINCHSYNPSGLGFTSVYNAFDNAGKNSQNGLKFTFLGNTTIPGSFYSHTYRLVFNLSSEYNPDVYLYYYIDDSNENDIYTPVLLFNQTDYENEKSIHRLYEPLDDIGYRKIFEYDSRISKYFYFDRNYYKYIKLNLTSQESFHTALISDYPLYVLDETETHGLYIFDMDLGSVTTFYRNSFYYLTSIKTITGNSVTAVLTPSGGSDTSAIFPNSKYLKTASFSSLKNITARMFSGLSSLTSITLGSIKTVGESAFEGCSSLGNFFNDLTFDNNSTINNFAFKNCLGITSITFPAGVKTMGHNPFAGCANLETISSSSSNTKYIADGNCLIDNEYSNKPLYVGCKNSVIPSNVKYIVDYAFSGQTGLTSISIPNDVNYIGSYAFEKCGLTSIDLSGLSSNDGIIVNGRAFADCENLSTIYLGSRITSIAYTAFYNTAYYNNSSNWSNGILYCGYYMLSAKSNEVGNSITTSAGVTRMANSIFSGYTTINSVELTDIAFISSSAFDGCRSLNEITFKHRISEVGSNAFRNVSSTGTVHYNSSVQSMSSLKEKINNATINNNWTWVNDAV